MEEGILSRLTEKKDIQTYIKVRLALLDGQEEEIVENVEESKREAAIKQVRGRRKELKELREVVNEGSLKEYSKEHWDEVDESSKNKS